MVGSLDFQVVKGSLMMPCGALQVARLVLHTKEVARNFRLATNERAFSRAPFGTIRLAFGLHTRGSKQGPKDHTGRSTQEGNSTQKNLHSEAESNRSAGQQSNAALKSGLSAGQSSDHPAGNTPPPPCTKLP